MKILFLFASNEGFNKYLPLMQQLLTKAHFVSTMIIGNMRQDAFQTRSLVDEKRSIAWNEIKHLSNIDVLFCEQEFAWLGMGHSYKESILHESMTIEDVLKNIPGSMVFA